MQTPTNQNASRSRLGLSIVISLLIVVVGTGALYAVQQSAMKPTGSKIVVSLNAYERQPDDLSSIANDSDLIVEGVVEKVYPSRWTTPSGKEPSNINEAMRDPKTQLRTPVQLSVETVFKGQNIPRSLLFTFAGGSFGNYMIQAGPDLEQLGPGTRLLVFLSKAPPDAGPWADISPLYPQLYFVVVGDTLHGPLKPVTRLDFTKQFGQGVKK